MVKCGQRDCLDREGILRLIQSIPSRNAEPFKLWLANAGEQNILETENPELLIAKVYDHYRDNGRDDARIRSMNVRNSLTQRWQEAGITFLLKGSFENVNKEALFSMFEYYCKIENGGEMTETDKELGEKTIFKKITFINTHPVKSKFFNKFPFFYKSKLAFNLPMNAKIIYNSEIIDAGEIDQAFGLNEPFIKKYEAILKASDGFPSEIKGGYDRFFYLSANTITGLGLGDILPITEWSRILVTIESLLGLVLVGLFINSIAIESK